MGTSKDFYIQGRQAHKRELSIERRSSTHVGIVVDRTPRDGSDISVLLLSHLPLTSCHICYLHRQLPSAFCHCCFVAAAVSSTTRKRTDQSYTSMQGKTSKSLRAIRHEREAREKRAPTSPNLLEESGRAQHGCFLKRNEKGNTQNLTNLETRAATPGFTTKYAGTESATKDGP